MLYLPTSNIQLVYLTRRYAAARLLFMPGAIAVVADEMLVYVSAKALEENQNGISICPF